MSLSEPVRRRAELYRWLAALDERRGDATVGSDEPVLSGSKVRRPEEWVRGLERMLGPQDIGGRDSQGGSGQVGVKKSERAALVAAE